MADVGVQVAVMFEKVMRDRDSMYRIPAPDGSHMYWRIPRIYQSTDQKSKDRHTIPCNRNTLLGDMAERCPTNKVYHPPVKTENCI